MVTPKEWFDAAQEALRRERAKEPQRTPLNELTLEELREASRILEARLGVQS